MIRQYHTAVVRHIRIAFIVAIVMALHVGVAFYILRRLEVPTTPAPPFPTVMDGKPVSWVPDPEFRKLGSLNPDLVESIHLGVDHAGITIKRKSTIIRFLKAMQSAVKRNPPGEELPSAGIVDPDSVAIFFDHPSPDAPEYWNSIFYADRYEGNYPARKGGTISPAFQDAMRTVGIPPIKVDSGIRPTRDTNPFTRWLRHLVWKFAVY